MATVKEEVKKLLDQLPDDVTLEDIQYHLYVRAAIEQGLEDIRKGRVISHKEAVRRMAKWLQEA